MSQQYSVGDLVADFLQQIGVTTAFGLVSVHNLPMLDAISRRNAIRFVMARGELGAANMADGYARAANDFGVLFSSTGPGAANAVGGLVEARFAGSPVLHFTGQSASNEIGTGRGTVHEVPDQLKMLESVSKAAFRITSAESALETLIKAATTARTAPSGPVSIEIPIDVQRTRLEKPEALSTLVLPTEPGNAGSEETLDRIAEALLSSKRPLLWCGNGAKYARKPVERLAEMGIPVVTSGPGRAVLPETHQMSLGAFFGVPLMERFYETVDLMVIAGGRLRGHETRDFSLVLPERRMQIDIDPAAENRTYETELFHLGDAEAALTAIADRLEGRLKLPVSWRTEIASLRSDIQSRFLDTLNDYRDMPAAFESAMGDDTVWVRDMTLNNTSWGNRMVPLADPSQNIYPISAAIGPGLALGIGAGFAAGNRKTLVMTGDGGFFLNVGELWTAVQEKLPITIVVMNDQGYGIIRHIQDTLYGGRQCYDDLKGPELEDLARISGISFRKVKSIDLIEEALTKAMAEAGPSLVEVDMTAIGEFPAFFQAPPYAEAEDA